MSADLKWENTVYLVLLTIIVMFILYNLLFFAYDPELVRDNERLAEKLKVGPLESLLNGSGINNIPQLNIITTNAAIATANGCGKGPVHIGDSGTDVDCVKVCANSSAKAVTVRPGDEYYYGPTSLSEGTHCVIGQRPECDTKTSIVLMTVNSVICRSRFPRMVGGELGTKIVACNNRLINDHKNVLWDYKYNAEFDPLATTVLDEDELLPDGTYRFRCKFGGLDDRGNRYQAHPVDRFHPIGNYCAALIYRAHPDIKTIFRDNSNDYECDCGDFTDTRAMNLVTDDKHSQCSALSVKVTDEGNQVETIELPYKCFTLFSPISAVASMPPCPNEQFTRDGSRMSSVKVTYTKNPKVILEHSLFREMSRNGVTSDPTMY